jgi:hypothetical protein
VCLGFRLSSKSLLPSDDYELGAGIRKRHKGPEEEHDALTGAGKARGRNQSWEERETSADFVSQVTDPLFHMGCGSGEEGWRSHLGVLTSRATGVVAFLYEGENEGPENRALPI